MKTAEGKWRGCFGGQERKGDGYRRQSYRAAQSLFNPPGTKGGRVSEEGPTSLSTKQPERNFPESSVLDLRRGG